MYVRNADGINKSAVHRLQTYHFASVQSLVDVPRWWMYHLWTPECCNPDSPNVREAVSPKETQRYEILGEGDDGGSSSRMSGWN